MIWISFAFLLFCQLPVVVIERKSCLEDFYFPRFDYKIHWMVCTTWNEKQYVLQSKIKTRRFSNSISILQCFPFDARNSCFEPLRQLSSVYVCVCTYMGICVLVWKLIRLFLFHTKLSILSNEDIFHCLFPSSSQTLFEEASTSLTELEICLYREYIDERKKNLAWQFWLLDWFSSWRSISVQRTSTLCVTFSFGWTISIGCRNEAPKFSITLSRAWLNQIMFGCGLVPEGSHSIFGIQERL
jgi:hypothetical protein